MIERWIFAACLVPLVFEAMRISMQVRADQAARVKVTADRSKT